MKRRNSLILLALACSPALQIARAQPAAGSPEQARPGALELQRQAIAKMQQSIVLQKLSVERQAGAGAPRNFFLLPPPDEIASVSAQGAMAFADCDPLPAPAIDSIVARAAAAQGLDPELLRGVIRQESGFRPCSVSPKGAVGLMQLMPATIEQFAVRDAFEPVLNVEAGAKFLKMLLKKYDGDLSRALAAYNAGPAAVDAAEGLPQLPETLDYVKRILSNLPGKKD